MGAGTPATALLTEHGVLFLVVSFTADHPDRRERGVVHGLIDDVVAELGALHGVITLLDIPDHWRYYVTMALNLLVGFEADSLERWSLDRRSWRMVGAVSGANYDECERRFFEGWVPAVAMVTPSNFDKPGAFEATSQPQRAKDGDLIPPKRGWRSQGGWRSWQRS